MVFHVARGNGANCEFLKGKTVTNPDMEIEHVGFIGMGMMGEPMARNLLKAGYKVSVWNRTHSKCEGIVEAGADLRSSAGDVAAHGEGGRPEVVFVCVTHTDDVRDVLFGETGIAKSAAKGLIVVDHSTIDAFEARAFAASLADKGVVYLDAPVSGGDVGAKAGTLSIMVGGDEAAYQRVLPALKAMGERINYMGESGMGQVAKSCNQIMVACNLAGVCEALMLAEKAGLDTQRMFDAVSGGAAGSWSLTNLGPRIMAGDFSPGFMVKDLVKDLGFVENVGRATGTPLSVTGLIETFLQSAAAMGESHSGTQALAKVYRKLSGD